MIVNDGQMAYEAVRAEPQRFDLVLLDIMMPVMDGMQAFSEIKKINTNIPIYAMSATASPEDTARLLAHGFLGNLAKPFNAAGILRLIQGQLAVSSGV